MTTALCGHWEHEPPCPLAPHHTNARRSERHVVLRILFAAEPDRVDDVRSRIDAALGSGHLRGPDGVTTHWALIRSGPGVVRPEERAHAGRLRDG